VRKASRISRAGIVTCDERFTCLRSSHPGAILYAKAFFESLLVRNKARLQALIAVARKLLHAIYGIFRSA